nr:hypothetical protein [Tanacetum cinerariifolium]
MVLWIVVVMVVVENITVVMIVVKNIMVEYFLYWRNFRSHMVVVDDTPIVIDKLDRVTIAFQKEDTAARKNLSFVTLRSHMVVVDDTPIVIDKLDRVTIAFQKEDTAARKNLSF